LSSEDAGNVKGISGGRTNAVEMGNKSGADGSVSKVAFHHAKLALSTFFPSIELNSLALYCLEFALIHSIPINISDNTRVLEIYDGIVDEELGGGGRVENVEVIIFDPRVVEVGRRVCMCVKGNGVLRVPPFANSYNVSVNSNLSEGDVSRYLILPILIEEDKRVLPRITVVVLTPSSSWMIRVAKLLSELRNIGDRARSGGERDGGVICSKFDWFVVLNVVVQHVTLNLVKDLRNEEKVLDGGVVTEGGGEDLVVKLSVP